jgi:chorismate mutase
MSAGGEAATNRPHIQPLTPAARPMSSFAKGPSAAIGTCRPDHKATGSALVMHTFCSQFGPTVQNGAMSDAVPDLSDLRQGIDNVDEQLVRLLAERSRLVHGVVRYKRANHMRVVDRAREDLMLERIGKLATAEGLDPRVAQHVLRSIIDSFTLLEVEELGPDA